MRQRCQTSCSNLFESSVHWERDILTFLKDLVDSLLGISAVLEVYVRDKHIHPNYAVEKLNFSDSYIRSVINFYKSKKEYVEEKNE